jgi:hypothetical protein
MQDVFVLFNNRVQLLTVRAIFMEEEGVNTGRKGITYHLYDGNRQISTFHSEKLMFYSKEELIESL